MVPAIMKLVAPSLCFFSKMKPLIVVVLLLGLSAASFADFPFKKKPQQFVTRNPDDVAGILLHGTPVQRNDLAVELGILAPNPSAAAGRTNSPCVDFTHVESKTVTLRAGDENVVLLADSSECDSVYLLAFDRAPKSEWRHVQTVRLASKVHRPEITFAEIIQPKVSEIVVHHEMTEDSGHARQEDFVVLKMLKDGIEVILDTTERSTLTLANRVPDESDDLQQTQASVFSLLKAPPGSPAAYRILEKQVLTGNKITFTRYLLWSWDPELERFRPVPFDGGDVRPVPPAAKKPAEKKPVTPPAKPQG